MLSFPTRIPFAALLGLQLQRYEGGECEVTLEPTPELLNSWDVVHGGVTMTLLDVTLAHAGRSSAATPPVLDVRGCATVEMKTTFMRPALGPLRCTAKVLQRSSSLVFVEGSVFDAGGRLVAHATGTFKFLRKENS